MPDHLYLHGQRLHSSRSERRGLRLAPRRENDGGDRHRLLGRLLLRSQHRDGPDQLRDGLDQLSQLRRGHPARAQPQRLRLADRLRRRQPALSRTGRLTMGFWSGERARERRGEAGFTLIEVLIAVFVLTLALLAAFGILSAAVRNGQRAKQTQVALDTAQQQLEKLHSLSYEELAMTTAPAHSSNPLSPNHRVVNGSFAVQREPVGEYATMAIDGGSLYGGGSVEGGVVTPGPIKFESGDVTGKLYRYVVWRDDPTCKESTVTAEDFCPGNQDYKQIVVA